MNIILIGGNGFIGKSLCSELLKNSNNRLTIISRSKNVEVNTDSIKRIFWDHKIDPDNFLLHHLMDADYIIYLASTTVPATSIVNPMVEFDQNLLPLIKVLKVASSLNIKKFIYFSSGGAVYGDEANQPILESAPTNPISSYGISKLAAEKFINLYRKEFGLNSIILRPSNPYGSGQYGNLKQGFMCSIVYSAIHNSEINIYGGEATVRDYIYIDDLVEAVLGIINFGKIGEIYNIGSGLGLNNLYIFELIKNIVCTYGYKLNPNFFPKRSFDVGSNILDISKINADTGWKPQTSVESGVTKTINKIMDFKL